jgi:hypothetical protein
MKRAIVAFAALSLSACVSGGQKQAAFWHKQCDPAQVRLSVGEVNPGAVTRYCSPKHTVLTGEVITRFGSFPHPQVSDVYYSGDGMIWLNPDDPRSDDLRKSLKPAVFPYSSEKDVPANQR